MKRILFLASIAMAFISCTQKTQLKINELEYFEERGVNVFVYNNLFTGGFNDEKNSGIEIIHHGVRTVQGGAVRLATTPEQWDLVPSTPVRNVCADSIDVVLQYEEYDFNSRVCVTPKGKAFEISVWLDDVLPGELEGKAGFNLEFLPSQYWNKSIIVDGKPDRFPRYAVSNTVARPNSEKAKQYKGYKTYDDRGTEEFVDPLPFVSGHKLVLSPEEPERMITITSDQELNFYDGRIVAQNGWYVLRTMLPSGKKGKVVSWIVEPNTIEGWIREPNIGFSQVGYRPNQPKVAVIELDKNDKVKSSAKLMKVEDDGSVSLAYKGKTEAWGPYYKYNYVKFDFSKVNQNGVYFIQYGDNKTENFIIGNDVYDKITIATSDVWIPIHMNHITVNEGYRVWHGEPFKEGYLQAPVNTDHFDLHSQGPTTDTKFKDLEHIPGLNVGGFFDAGDFDIETGSNISVVTNLVNIWERYRPLRDETFVSQKQRYVDLHRPDGTPDIIQFIEHGTLNLVAQAEQIGHMSSTLSNSVLDNYHHLGDAGSITDGLIYDPSLKPYEVSKDGKHSGTPDDMWAFTSRNPGRDLQAANMFALASRALKDYNPDLASRALAQSERLNKEANEILSKNPNMNARGRYGANVSTNLQLYVSTGEQEYLNAFNAQIWPMLENNSNSVITPALEAVPYMDEAYKTKLRPYIEKYTEYIKSLEKDNPYAVPIGKGNWAGSGQVVNYGTTLCLASTYYPDIVSQNEVFKVTSFMFGCHPYHNYSLVATVGATRPKAVFYGNNRADFSFIPGNVAPGILFRSPDHFENYDDWPFFWGQNEGTIAGNVSYLYFGLSFLNLLNHCQ